MLNKKQANKIAKDYYNNLLNDLEKIKSELINEFNNKIFSLIKYHASKGDYECVFNVDLKDIHLINQKALEPFLMSGNYTSYHLIEILTKEIVKSLKKNGFNVRVSANDMLNIKWK